MRPFRGVKAALLSLALIAALGAAAFAQSSGADSDVSEARQALEEAASAVREQLSSIPDPAQLATQASEEALSQGTPRKERQLVYSISANTGQRYEGGFAPQQANTIYLQAHSPAIVNVQRTDVYYWPITREYMADWFGFQEDVEGRLEIVQGGRVVQTLERTDYAYVYPQGYDGPQELRLGEEAIAAYEDYQSRLDAYFDAVSAYYDAYTEWNAVMTQILREVQETGVYKDPSEIPDPPRQPVPPADFAWQPRKAFILDLPPGRYTVRMKDGEGNVVPGSEKRLDVFTARRAGTAMIVRPEDKWTRPFQSSDPSDVFYLDGRRVFYITPHVAQEFNLYKWVKMYRLNVPLEGEGMTSVWSWVPFDPITEATLQVLRNGEVVEEVELAGYYVQQTAGSALGYQVVRADEIGRDPHFQAFRVVLESSDGSYQIRLVDREGNVIPGSEREVRSVRQPGSVAYVIPLLPVGVGVGVFAWRRSKAKVSKGVEA